jgi:hypothetical protein
MFEKAGFRVIQAQTVSRNGVELVNYQMELLAGEQSDGGEHSLAGTPERLSP